jgi:hypothetical protein
MSALFVAADAFDPNGIGARFESASSELPARVKEFVLVKIRGYAAPT